MVQIKRGLAHTADYSNTQAWLDMAKSVYPLTDTHLLAEACSLLFESTRGLTTFYGQSYLERGLQIAEISLDLHLDQQTAAASLICGAINAVSLPIETIEQCLGKPVAELVANFQQIEIIPILQTATQRDKSQSDQLRKMLLAMAKDIRVVIIKLAERVCFLRGIKAIPKEERARFAQEIVDVYAPLANRLGIGQLKWELEDLAFHYIDPEMYKTIARFLAERRADRETQIDYLVANLKHQLTTIGLSAEITGRAKHIYSIYLKTKRKQLNFKDVYDYNAVRILVNTIEECYQALGMVHSVWQPIIEEFDDYIAKPKSNGYRSIHTAVIDQQGKQFEIQIRTHAMHEEAERGVAAHWIYKEEDHSTSNEATKINYLRQLIDWHQEVAQSNNDDHQQSTVEANSSHIHAITPAGDILELPQGATPLDFAYHLHSELGHRCRGAKINNQIVPLTYTLKTGDRVELITIVEGKPSRDWLSLETGYLKTSRARNKVAHWFKQQQMKQDIMTGKEIFERECARNGLGKSVQISVIARHFQFKDEDAFFIGLTRGSIRPGQILQALQPKTTDKPSSHIKLSSDKQTENSIGASIVGNSHLLTRIAKCCKPIPGDAIIGYITQGRGISLHKKNCSNAAHLSDPRRFIVVDWNNEHRSAFYTDLKIIAHDERKILNDLTSLLSNEKIEILHFSSLKDNHHQLHITFTVKIENITQVNHLIKRLQQLPHVIAVNRA